MYLPDPTLEAVLAAIQSLQPQSQDVVLVLVGEAASVSVDALVAQLRETPWTFVGVRLPAVIANEQQSATGMVIKTLPTLHAPYVIPHLNEAIALPDFETDLQLTEDQQPTALVWIDGLSSQISTFLAELYNHLGNAVRYLGGGAGSLSLQQQPCLFTREGCFQDAAVILFTPWASRLGVQHGWQRLQGPLPATRTHHNTLIELNWRNAFEVYRETVEPDSQQRMTPDNFFAIAKGYPFGICKEGQEDVVRDPIMVNADGHLVCVGEVPENALLYILRGDQDSLVASARQAAAMACRGEVAQFQDCLVVDCISRALFLGDGFGDELAALRSELERHDRAIVVEGCLTLGEISSYGDGFLEFFNKTIVVGAFYQQS